MPRPMLVYWSFAVIAPVSSFLSLVLLITVHYAWDEEIIRVRKYHMANIFWLSFSDFLLSTRSTVGVFCDFPTGSLGCSFMGCVGVFSFVATQSWYFIICTHLFITLRWKSMQQYLRKRNLVHIFVWCTSFSSTLLPINKYVRDEVGDCWVTRQGLYKFTLFIPLTIYLFLTIIMFWLIISEIWPALRGKKRLTILLRTSVFVLVFLITWFPSWVNLVLQPFLETTIPLEYEQYAILFGTASGIFNCIAWCYFFPDHRYIWKIIRRKKECSGDKRKYLIEASNSEMSLATTPSKTYSQNTTSMFREELSEHKSSMLFPKFRQSCIPSNYSETYLLLSCDQEALLSIDEQNSSRKWFSQGSKGTSSLGLTNTPIIF